MRLIHTADWHLGRRLKGVDRTPEIEAALDELLQQAKTLEVDAVLVAGDLFETANPTTEAERIAYRFFCGLQEAKIPAVVIAGNHDSAFRLDNVADLLSLAGVHALGKPRLAQQGGVIMLETASGKLCVGAMPFASEKRLLKAEDLWGKDSGEQRQHYRDRVKSVLQNLANGFRDDSVNVLMAHLAIESAQLSQSERNFECTGNYALSEGMLPVETQYIALGHIHKPQSIQAAVPTHYSGSLIQVDFGEAGEEKGFKLITIDTPGSPAKVEFKTLNCQKPLKQIECKAAELDEMLEAHREHPGWLKIRVELESPIQGLADRVKKICTQAIHIETCYPNSPEKRQARQAIDFAQFDPVQEFQHYYRDRKNIAPSPALLDTFQKLYIESTEAEHASH